MCQELFVVKGDSKVMVESVQELINCVPEIKIVFCDGYDVEIILKHLKNGEDSCLCSVDLKKTAEENAFKYSIDEDLIWSFKILN